jgi:hypothetical protein
MLQEGARGGGGGQTARRASFAFQTRLAHLSRFSSLARDSRASDWAGKAARASPAVNAIFAGKAMQARGALAAGATDFAAETTQTIGARFTVGTAGAGQTSLSVGSGQPRGAFRSLLVAHMCELLLQRLLICNELVDGVDGVLQLHAEVQVFSAREGSGTAQAGNGVRRLQSKASKASRAHLLR